jgi:tetratricopeptide (TPR) repeat protein
MRVLVATLSVLAALAFEGRPHAGPMPAPGNAKDSPLSSADQQKHNDLYKRGIALINPYMRLNDRPSKKSADTTRDLREGIRLLDEALKLAPDNWAALWMQGKAYQVLEEHEQAYVHFKRSFAIQRENADVARELMLECLELHRWIEAAEVGGVAVSRSPKDAGLRANLALALLLAGHVDDANDVANAALRMDSSDQITKDLVRKIGDVRSGRRPPPRSVSDLEK